MRILQGKQVHELGTAQLQERIAAYRQVIVDLGTGDGNFVYKQARAHPQDLYIGIDSTAENMTENAVRIMRRPERGGLANALYVIANAEDLPPELDGIAHTLHINFPWGSLLSGLVLGDAQLLDNIARLCRPAAQLAILLNYTAFYERTPIELQQLPQLTIAHVDQNLAPAYARAGLPIVGRALVGREELAHVPTTWARRLAANRELATLAIDAVRSE